MSRVWSVVAIVAALAAASVFAQAPVGGAFTYQGQLKDQGQPGNGPYNMQFRLYGADVGGTPLATYPSGGATAVTVQDGLFVAVIDFGTAVFNGEQRWLEIVVDGVTLAPRQELTVTPYALYALNGPGGGSYWQAGAGGAIYYNDGNVGIGMPNPGARLNAYSVGGTALMGQSGTGTGVYGVSNTDAAVMGYNLNSGAIGRLGYQQYAVYGEKPGGFAGYFDGDAYIAGNLGIGASEPLARLHIGGTAGTDGIIFPDGTLQTTAAPPGGLTLPYAGTVASSTPAFSVTNTGSNNAAVFTSYGGHALYAMTYSDFWALRVETQGSGCAGSFFANNTSSTAPAVAATHAGDGPAFHGYTYGAAPAGKFEINNTASSSPAVYALTNGLGPAVLADGTLDIGSATRDGQLQLFRSGSSSAIARLYDKADWGGALELRDLFGNATIRLEADTSGEGGGFLWIGRNPTSPGFRVDGNIAGGEPRVEITGSVRSAAFHMDQSGDASVALPTSAISAVEMLDEPGVASNTSDGPITPASNVYTELRSANITTPAGGYVLVIGTCEASDVGADDARVAFGVSNTNSSLPANQDVEHQVKLAASDSVRTPITVHGLFSAGTAGTYTYYFLCRKTAGGFNYSVSDIQFTLAYFPTAYGTVSSTVSSDRGVPLASDGNMTGSAPPQPGFDWNSTGVPDIGLIAREVECVLPDLVIRDADGQPDGMHYDKLALYLMGVIEDQRKQLGGQQAQIAAQQDELSSLRARLEKIEALLADPGAQPIGGGR